MKILLIDDEPFLLKVLSHQLGNLGFRDVTTCLRAQEGLATLEADGAAFGLVFCDLQMPEMDGVEFLRNLARIGYTGRLVLVSGEDERILRTAEKLARAHQLDVLGVLNKPVAREQLEQLLDGAFAPTAKVPRADRRVYEPEELARAIANGELVNYYQPKVALATGAVVGAECLVRWRHPEHGLVFPDQFIGVAERHGLIDALTHAVLAQALAQVRAWREAGLAWRVAVNVSMNNLVRVDFSDLALAEITRAGVATTDLVLEVTESRLMEDPLAPLDILTRLRLKRVGLSIDDFGTGHSSLAQLRDMPFDEIKLDRSFVHGVRDNDTLRAIFDASHGMARQLGMEIVAEGVEDWEDWEFLRERGCDLAQGYFIARPMPAADLPRWLAGWEIRCAGLVGLSS